MAVAYFTQWPPADPDLSTRVGQRIGEQLGNQQPAGGLYHAEGPTEEGGWWSFDVWATEEDFETFRQQFFQPALDEFNAPDGDRRQLQVHWDTSQLGGGP